MERTAVSPVTWSVQMGFNQGGIVSESALSIDNLEAVLAEAGMSVENLVRLNVYTTDVE
jgi:enamine deaminase RidA (YjgF/YER057c/UK114 family)